MGKTRYRKLKTKSNLSNISSITTMNHGIKKNKYSSIKHKKQTQKGTQTGGFLGNLISWIRLKWKLSKFKKLIGKFNRLELDVKSRVDAYKARADYFEKFANDYAQSATNFIINTRQLTILEIFKKDKDELVASDPLTSKKVARNIEISKSRAQGIVEDINAQVDIMSKEIPTFNKLKDKFEGEAERFKSYVKDFSELRGYQSELKALQTKYNSLSGQDISKLPSEDKDFLKTYEKRKDEYEQIIRLSDDVIQTHMENVNEIDNLLIKTQYFKSQFGVFEKEDAGLRTRKKGAIDKAKIVADKKLKEWKQKFTEFAKKMFTVADTCDTIIKKLEELEKSSKLCLTNMYTIYKTEKDDRSDVKIQKHNVDAMTTFNQDISELIKDFNVAAAHIKELKREFYHQTPAVRMGYDYIPLVSAFNYLEVRLDLYKKVLNGVKYKTQSGGALICATFHKVLNRDILKDEDITKVNNIFKTLRDLHDELKNKTPSCYDTLDHFKKNFNNFYNYWLFCLFMITDIINDPSHIPQPLKPILRVLVDMSEVLEKCGPGKTYNYDDVKNYFEIGFAEKITQLPKKSTGLDTNQFRDNNLYHIFINPGIAAIKNNADFRHLDRFLNSISRNMGDEFDLLENAPLLKTYIEHEIKIPRFPSYQFITGSPSPRASGSKATKWTLTEITNLKAEVDSSPLLMGGSEIANLLELILPEIGEQETMGMQFKDTDKVYIDLNNILDEIKNKVNTGAGITAQDDTNYKTVVVMYIKYWSEVKGIYDKIKNNSLSDDKTAKDKALEYWSYIDKHGYLKAIDKLLTDAGVTSGSTTVSAASGASSTSILGSPPALAGAIAAGGTPMSGVTSSGSVVPNSGPPSDPSKYPLGPQKQSLDDKDVKLLENILIQIPSANEVQYKFIKAEVDNMKAILNDIIKSPNEGLIKDLANELQRMTQLLFEVKYLEPDLLEIKVKKDESINLDLDWVLKPIDADLKEAHKTATAGQLEELIKKHPELYKIHQQKSTASGNLLEKAYEYVNSFFGSIPEFTNRISELFKTDNTYTVIFYNKDNVEAFLKIFDTKLDAKANTQKACVLLNGLIDVNKYNNKPEIKKLLEEKKKEWDPKDNCKQKPPKADQPGQQGKPPRPPAPGTGTTPPRNPRYGAANGRN